MKETLKNWERQARPATWAGRPTYNPREQPTSLSSSSVRTEGKGAGKLMRRGTLLVSPYLPPSSGYKSHSRAPRRYPSSSFPSLQFLPPPCSFFPVFFFEFFSTNRQ